MQEVKDNLDAVGQRMLSIANQFEIISKEMESWDAKYKGNDIFEKFKRYVSTFSW